MSRKPTSDSYSRWSLSGRRDAIAAKTTRKALWSAYFSGLALGAAAMWVAAITFIASSMGNNDDGSLAYFYSLAFLIAVAILAWVWLISERLCREAPPIGYGDTATGYLVAFLTCLPFIAPWFLAVPHGEGDTASESYHYAIFSAFVIVLPSVRMFSLATRRDDFAGKVAFSLMIVYDAAIVGLLLSR